MKRIAALFMAVALLAMGAGAYAESAMPAAVPGAFAGPSTEFSMATAFHVLANFIHQDGLRSAGP